MVKKTIQIHNRSGLHLRPAGQLCQKALEYPCEIKMVVGEKTFNLKSVLSVLSAQITTSREIELVCDGKDEARALEEMERFLSVDLGGEQPA